MSARWSSLTALLCFFCAQAHAAYTLNMPSGVTTVSQEIYKLHMTILWVCIAIGIVVYGVMLYAIVYHRKARGHAPANFHESTTIEIIWTIIPFVILLLMAIPATKTLIQMTDTRDAEVTIKITGHRWFWQYEYPDEGLNFFSYLSSTEDEIRNKTPKGVHYLLEVDKPVVIPVGKKVRFLVTAKDVIHSWWVPDLGIKRDAIPGFIHETWTFIDPAKPGLYRGQCAELCGANHGYMPIVVDARPQAEYDAWIAEQKEATAASTNADPNKVWPKEELMAHGEQEYNQICAMCHKASGEGLPPTFPSLVGSAIVTQAGHIDEHIRQIIFGKNAMPAFGTQKTDFDIAAIVTYERNAWGNSTGDVIQPSDVKKIRDAGKSA